MQNNANEHMRIINIVPTILERRQELSADCLKLKEECGITDVAFILRLMPEEKIPTMAKAEHLRDVFRQMREPLAGSGLRIGLYINSLIGHNVPTDAGFQRSVNSEGIETNSMCPLDPAFLKYVRNAVATVAQTRPDFFLIDDDFRLANCGGTGCFCKLHLEEFGRLEGRSYSREELLAATGKDKTLKKRWKEFCLSSLLSAAREIRAGINDVDPNIPCGNCIPGALGSELDFVKPIHRVLAGGKPSFLRIANASYMEQGGKDILGRLYWTGAQLDRVRGSAELLAESDTWPQNRYSTSANTINSQFILSLLDGVSGAKLWLTRMREYEPDSGLAYRAIFKKNLPLYQELFRLRNSISWNGPVTPVPQGELSLSKSGIWYNNWTCSVLGRMGIPCRVANANDAKVIMLSGAEPDYFSDDELKYFVSQGLLLDGPAAVKMCERGFSDFLGVNVDMPPGWTVHFERIGQNPGNGKAAGKIISMVRFGKNPVCRITVTHPEAVELSRLYKTPWDMSPDESFVGSGVTLYENNLGGRIAVCAAPLDFNTYMNEIRKEQLINILSWLDADSIPVVIDSDINIYARHGLLRDNGGKYELLYIFNMSADILPELVLRTKGENISSILKLESSGFWKELAFRKADVNKVIVGTNVNPAEPLILKISGKKE